MLKRRRQIRKRCTVAQGTRLSLQEKYALLPVVSLPVLVAQARMVGHDHVASNGYHPLRIQARADDCHEAAQSNFKTYCSAVEMRTTGQTVSAASERETTKHPLSVGGAARWTNVPFVVVSVLDLCTAVTVHDLELEGIGHAESGRFRFDKAPKIAT
ncbi:MAG: hypothetical protein KGK35_03750 [Xanthomonadaceae bacterium]|nr:hypothetical protein [Xanthomonadaceae bacterium]